MKKASKSNSKEIDYLMTCEETNLVKKKFALSEVIGGAEGKAIIAATKPDLKLGKKLGLR